MSRAYDHQEIPIPLVQIRQTAHLPAPIEEDDGSQGYGGSATDPGANDRIGAGASGTIAGLFAGAGALGVVQLLAPAAIAGPVHLAATRWGVDLALSYAVAYGTAASVGALVGAGFASVTRYLRRWFPLLLWAVVFFVSLSLLLLALARTYGPSSVAVFAPAILAASGAYAFVVSFALPIRRRG